MDSMYQVQGECGEGLCVPDQNVSLRSTSFHMTKIYTEPPTPQRGNGGYKKVGNLVI